MSDPSAGSSQKELIRPITLPHDFLYFLDIRISAEPISKIAVLYLLSPQPDLHLRTPARRAPTSVSEDTAALPTNVSKKP